MIQRLPALAGLRAFEAVAKRAEEKRREQQAEAAAQDAAERRSKE